MASYYILPEGTENDLDAFISASTKLINALEGEFIKHRGKFTPGDRQSLERYLYKLKTKHEELLKEIKALQESAMPLKIYPERGTVDVQDLKNILKACPADYYINLNVLSKLVERGKTK